MAPGSAPPSRHIVVVANGDVPARAALASGWPGWDTDIHECIAADGGLARARAVGFRPVLLVGDLDSVDAGLDAALGDNGLEIRRAPVAKDESDTELALLAAIERGATRVTVLGALGGTRLDHALANLWLLAHPSLRGVEVVLLDEHSRISLVTAPGPGGGAVTRALPGPLDAPVSLLPMGGDVTGITTEGFRYPLRGEPLLVGPSRGLSNLRVRTDARVSVERGRLLVVESASPTGGLSSAS